MRNGTNSFCPTFCPPVLRCNSHTRQYSVHGSLKILRSKLLVPLSRAGKQTGVGGSSTVEHPSGFCKIALPFRVFKQGAHCMDTRFVKSARDLNHGSRGSTSLRKVKRSNGNRSNGCKSSHRVAENLRGLQRFLESNSLK